MQNKMTEYRIANFEDIIDIKALVDEYIGTDFYSMDEIEAFIRNDNSNIIVYVPDEGHIKGYLFSLVTDFDDACDILHIRGDDKQSLSGARPKLHNGDVGILKTISVDKKYRGGNVACRLVEETINWFRKKGVDIAIGEAIKRPDGYVNASYVMKKTGLNELFEIKNPWIGIKSYCPYCKKDYCECNAVIFYKGIDNE